MKKYFILIFIASIFAFNSFSQAPFGEISYDTLQDGNILVKIPQEAGTFFEMLFTPEDYLPPKELYVNTFTFDYSSYYQDDLKSNIFAPDDIGGCIPLDFCYNPYMEKLYYYGGRNVVVVDAVTREKLKEMTVSEVADVTYTSTWHAYSAYSKEKGYRQILFNPLHNKVYCATLGGELVIIDCDTDLIVNTIITDASYSIFSTAIALDFNNDNILWFVNELFSTEIMSHLYKVDCNIDLITSHRKFYYTGIYDVIPSNNDTTILVSTFNNANQKIHVINTANLATITQFGESNVGKLFINPTTNILYADLLTSNSLLAYNLNNYQYLGGINISYERILQGFVNSNYNLLYLNAINSSESGVIVIDCNLFSEVAVHQGSFSFALCYDNINSLVYFSGNNFMKAFNANANFQQIIYQSANNGNVPTRILSGPEQGIITSNQVSGTTSFFDYELNLEGEAQIGANMVYGCYNATNEKVYYIHSFTSNINSYIAIYDAITLEILSEIPLAGYLNDVVYNSHNNKVYVSCRDNHRVYVIDGVTDQIIQNETILLPQNKRPMKLYVSKENNIYVSVPSSIFIYDGSNHTLLNQLSTNLWTFSFEENYLSNIVYAGQYSSGSAVIIAVNDLTQQIISNINIDGFAFDMCYNSVDNVIYASSLLGNKIYEIKGTNIVKSHNLGLPTYLAYNYIDNKVYCNSLNGNLTVFKNSEISKSLQFAPGVIHYSGMNNQLYGYWLTTTTPNQILVVDATLDEITRVIPMKQMQKANPWYGDSHKTLVLAKKNNRLFTGNFAFSNLSVVQGHIDTLPLRKGWTWLSFPRLERYENNTVHPGPVLERTGCFPVGWELYSINKDIYYNLGLNDWIGDLTEVMSTEGYKLYGEVPDEECLYITLQGARLHPDTPITLSPGIENWIGYFPINSLYPWNAFPEDLYNNYLTEIKAQYWTMVKMQGQWVAAGNVTPIKYGDMVIVKISGTTPVTFSWYKAEKDEECEGYPETEHYEFDEQADYLPVYIETEPDSDIQEIAILADNEVKGAVVRLPGDTLVQLNAYIMDVAPGTPLEFETWSGYKSQRTGKGAYSVLNHQTRRYEQRPIYSGENKPFQFVSLKPKTETDVQPLIPALTCSPNPFSEKTVFNLTLGEEANLQLTIYDHIGKVVAIPVSGTFAPGNYSFAWNGQDLHGKQSGNGVYIYRFNNSNGKEFSGKIVLIK